MALRPHGPLNVMWHVGKFDEATWNLAAMTGMITQYLLQANRGIFGLSQKFLAPDS